MFILEPNEITRALARKKVTIYDFPDGRIGFSELTMAALLGHASRGVTQRYVHIDEAPRMAADRVAEEMTAILEARRPSCDRPESHRDISRREGTKAVAEKIRLQATHELINLPLHDGLSVPPVGSYVFGAPCGDHKTIA